MCIRDRYWSGLEFGLLLSYGDEQVGVIQDESTFDAATDMVNARMVHAAPQDAEAAVSLTPVFSLVAADKSAYTSAAAVCDAIIEQSDGIIAEEMCIRDRWLDQFQWSNGLQYAPSHPYHPKYGQWKPHL